MKYFLCLLASIQFYISSIAQSPETDKYIFILRIPATKHHGGMIQTAFRLKGTKGLITTLHGVADGEIFSAINESNFVLNRLRIVSVDISNDIALVGSDELNNLPADGLEIGTMKSAEQYYVKGHPIGISLYTKPVTIDAFAYKSLAKLIPAESVKAFDNRKSPDLLSKIIDINSGNLVSGNSGSPLIDSHNRIIGIVDGGLLKGAAGISWAIPIDRLELIDSRKTAGRLTQIMELNTDNLFSFEMIPDQIQNSFKIVSMYRQMDYTNLKDGLNSAHDGDTLFIEEGDYSGENFGESRPSQSSKSPPALHRDNNRSYEAPFSKINIEKNITLVGVGDSSKIILPWIFIKPYYRLGVANLTFVWPVDAGGTFLANHCSFKVGSTINVSGETEIYNSAFSPKNPQNSQGIIITNGTLIMKNCEFRNFETAIKNVFASSADIQNTRFYNCNIGVWISRYSATTIKNCEFIKTKVTIKKDLKTLLSKFSGVLIEEGNKND